MKQFCLCLCKQVFDLLKEALIKSPVVSNQIIIDHKTVYAFLQICIVSIHNTKYSTSIDSKEVSQHQLSNITSLFEGSQLN